MRRNRCVGVHGKAVHTGTAGSRQGGVFPLVAKPRADAPDLLAGPLPKSDAVLDRSRHGAGELRSGVAQGIIPGGHGGLHARLQISAPTQLTEDAVTELLEDRGNVRIAGRFDCDKAGRAARCGAIEGDALQEDTMEMEVHIERTAETLDNRHRPRLDLVAWDP